STKADRPVFLIDDLTGKVVQAYRGREDAVNDKKKLVRVARSILALFQRRKFIIFVRFHRFRYDRPARSKQKRVGVSFKCRGKRTEHQNY
ncbi:hypothetical protein, partial [Pseudomonas viridiflava]|uniref:hypothetical protein n=1 Tax=Pseudomonas viridiflava TaxID=33069 RepID=UPI00197DF8C1